MPEPHTFGFKATYTPGYYDGEEQGWKVSLPHQCDSWAITADSDYDSPVPKAEAVARLSQFIAEAQGVLEQIRATPDSPASEIQFGRGL
ncbi:hypothetical protein GCM10010172_35450 [Paractinoplanes ferrugineus]|uniref:Uncharacterized protein n=1 Tax=Paractinoplanes ferrugineus TaxID=113564 RepID=A0A919MR03_9ACTN|nr:hypothetical protein [Actinoplanes ferrugineus]GIE16877.1 hypothetical protein Afe05nite_87170 [Actinoplanes ferrugineus]